jgi:hypothetical protein
LYNYTNRISEPNPWIGHGKTTPRGGKGFGRASLSTRTGGGRTFGIQRRRTVGRILDPQIAQKTEVPGKDSSPTVDLFDGGADPVAAEIIRDGASPRVIGRDDTPDRGASGGCAR